MTWLPAKLTPMGPEEIRALLRARFGARQADILTAQIRLETGNGQRLWRYNFGNLKATSINRPYQTLRNVSERDASGALHRYQPEGEEGQTTRWDVPPGHPQTRFRAYETAEEGLDDFLGLLRSKRFRRAWTALAEGNAEAYFRELRKAGYFTATFDEYWRGVRPLLARPAKREHSSSGLFLIGLFGVGIFVYAGARRR